MNGQYEHSEHKCCKVLCQWQHWLSLMKKRLVQTELKHLSSLWSYSTQTFPGTRKVLQASHAAPTHLSTEEYTATPHPHNPLPWCLLVPHYLEQQQSATNMTPGVFWLGIQKSLHNPVGSQCCCLGKSLPALQPSAFGRFSPQPYGLNASPPLAMKA